jgi:hypothetical protein
VNDVDDAHAAAEHEVENAVFRLVGDEARDAGPADHTKGYGDRGIESAAGKAGMDLGRAAWRFAAMGVFPGPPDAEGAWPPSGVST